MQILNVQNKILMDLKIILKVNLQKSKRTCSIRFFNAYNVFFRSIENNHDICKGQDYMKKVL